MEYSLSALSHIIVSCENIKMAWWVLFMLFCHVKRSMLDYDDKVKKLTLKGGPIP